MKTPEQVLKEWVSDKIVFRFPKITQRLRHSFTRAELAQFIDENLFNRGRFIHKTIAVHDVILSSDDVNKLRRRIRAKRFQWLLEPRNFARLESYEELYRVLGFQFDARTFYR